jgi:hypothetical protein
LTNSREFNKNESTSLSFLPLLRERVEAHDRDSYHEFMMLGNTTTKQLTSNKTHTHTHTHTLAAKRKKWIRATHIGRYLDWELKSR